MRGLVIVIVVAVVIVIVIVIVPVVVIVIVIVIVIVRPHRGHPGVLLRWCIPCIELGYWDRQVLAEIAALKGCWQPLRAVGGSPEGLLAALKGC